MTYLNTVRRLLKLGNQHLEKAFRNAQQGLPQYLGGPHDGGGRVGKHQEEGIRGAGDHLGAAEDEAYDHSHQDRVGVQTLELNKFSNSETTLLLSHYI